MALSSFLQVNGVDFPCPHVGFQYIISTAVNAGRNADNQVIGQKVGRDVIKLDSMEWIWLPPDKWQQMLRAVEDFYVPVTFEDYRTGKPTTITMYPGDRTAKPYYVDKNSHIVTRYESCKFNLIDTGW